MKAFRGAIIHSPYDELGKGVEIILDALTIVKLDGNILEVVDLSKSQCEDVIQQHCIRPDDIVELAESEVILPGFIDVHLHAPQYSYTGTATDRPLMEWLEHYTFPAESSHNDNLAWAEEVYSKLVRRLLANGTTTAVYFATMHARPAMVLADVCCNMGQRALIGKVNMDRNSPSNYIETADESIASTELVIAHIKSKGLPELLIPVITPRFVPTCTPGDSTPDAILFSPQIALHFSPYG
jgi:guanine deaminase